MQIFKVPDLLLIIGSGRLNFYGSGSLKDREVCGFPNKCHQFYIFANSSVVLCPFFGIILSTKILHDGVSFLAKNCSASN